MKRISIIFVKSVALLILFNSQIHAQEAPLKVVASFSILGDLIKQVGGDNVVVSLIVGTNRDAHNFSPSPQDAAKLKSADLIVINGLGFEMWADRFVKASGYQGVKLVASKGIKALKPVGDAHGLYDPHAWQDVDNVKIYIKNIRDELINLRPNNKNNFEFRANRYLDQLNQLQHEIKTTFNSIPSERRRVVTSHDAFTYFGDAYGILFYAPVGISGEAEASAQKVAQLITQIRSEKITAVFIENISNGRVVEMISKETGAKIGGILYSDALSSNPEASSYINMMRHNTKLISSAMK